MRLISFIFIVFAMLAPFISSISLVFPFSFPEVLWFSVFSFSGLLFAFLNRIPLFSQKFSAGKAILQLQRPGILSLAIIFWTVVSIIQKEFIAFSYLAFFFSLLLSIFHEEEWLRLSRFLLWMAALSAWFVIVGEASRPLLISKAPLFASAFILSLVFLLRSKTTRIGRFGYGISAFWLLSVLIFLSIPFSEINQAREMMFWKLFFSKIQTGAEIFIALIALWLAILFSLAMIYLKKASSWQWAVGLTIIFLIFLRIDPWIVSSIGSGMMFFFLCALIEWVVNSSPQT